MEDFDKRDTREDVFSRVVKAGVRTYFFDVKYMRDSELYITVTESKKRFDNALAKFVYDKHKIFLYQEDFEKFMHGLQDTFSFIETGKVPPKRVYKEVKRLSDIDTDSHEQDTES